MLSVLEETANSAAPTASGFCTTCGCHPQCQARSRGLTAVLPPPQTLRGWVAELRCPLRGATKRSPHPHPPMLPCPKWPLVPPPPPFCSRTRESPAPWRGAGRLQVGLARGGPALPARRGDKMVGADGGPQRPGCTIRRPSPPSRPRQPPGRHPAAPLLLSEAAPGSFWGRGAAGGADGGNGLGWLQSRSA